jgi:hypothetical protein
MLRAGCKTSIALLLMLIPNVAIAQTLPTSLIPNLSITQTLPTSLRPNVAIAQTLPTSQPNMITIVREEVKLGRDADHAKVEAGWPAAYEKAKSLDYYLAMTSMTGAPEAWYVTAYASHAAIGDSLKREDGDPVLTAELTRLRRADADMISSVRVIQARARTDLSYGAYPDLAKQRFFEMTWFRVRPGHEPQFEAAGKAYGAAAKRTGATSTYRVYEVVAGVPGPTYLMISSLGSYGEFDQVMTDGDKTMKGASAEEGMALQKFMLEGVVNVETQRFRVDPLQSYVPKETRAQDPAFWMPKKALLSKPTTQQQ